MGKFLIYLLALCFIVGCSSGDSGSDSPANPTSGKDGGNAGGQGQKNLKWGQLKCQLQLNCENIVLGLSVDSWKSILTDPFLENIAQQQVSTEEKSFKCGAQLLVSLQKESPQFVSLKRQDKLNIVNFVEYVFDTENCQVKAKLEENMNKYINI